MGKILLAILYCACFGIVSWAGIDSVVHEQSKYAIGICVARIECQSENTSAYYSMVDKSNGCNTSDDCSNNAYLVQRGCIMAWYVVLIADVKNPNLGNVTAQVQQFANAAAYQQTVGDSPTHVDPNQPANGYPTQQLAQAEANKWNSQPKDKRSSGSIPAAPNLALPILKNPLTDVLGGINIGSWFLRIGEILLGLVLVGVGLARLTHAQNVISQVVKTRLP